MSQKDLIAACVARNLDTTGSKDDLRNRLLASLVDKSDKKDKKKEKRRREPTEYNEFVKDKWPDYVRAGYTQPQQIMKEISSLWSQHKKDGGGKRKMREKPEPEKQSDTEKDSGLMLLDTKLTSAQCSSLNFRYISSGRSNGKSVYIYSTIADDSDDSLSSMPAPTLASSSSSPCSSSSSSAFEIDSASPSSSTSTHAAPLVNGVPSIETFKKQLAEQTLDDLKKTLYDLGKPSDGTKEVLVERLLNMNKV
jgi:hypothetical protein